MMYLNDTDFMQKRQQRTIGALVKIPLEGDFHSYARILEQEMAFYDIFTKEELPAEEIIKHPVLFITAVFDSAITKGHWAKISKALPLEKHLLNIPPKYTQDALNPDKYSLIYTDKQVSVTREECEGLEYWAIWTAEDIERRLNDYLAQKKNPYIERMKRAEMYSVKNSGGKKIRLHNIDKKAV